MAASVALHRFMPLNEASQRRAPRIPDDVWARYDDDCFREYMQGGISQIIRWSVKQTPDFRPTRAQLNHRKRRWEARKICPANSPESRNPGPVEDTSLSEMLEIDLSGKREYSHQELIRIEVVAHLLHASGFCKDAFLLFVLTLKAINYNPRTFLSRLFSCALCASSENEVCIALNLIEICVEEQSKSDSTMAGLEHLLFGLLRIYLYIHAQEPDSAQAHFWNTNDKYPDSHNLVWRIMSSSIDLDFPAFQLVRTFLSVQQERFAALCTDETAHCLPGIQQEHAVLQSSLQQHMLTHPEGYFVIRQGVMENPMIRQVLSRIEHTLRTTRNLPPMCSRIMLQGTLDQDWAEITALFWYLWSSMYQDRLESNPLHTASILSERCASDTQFFQGMVSLILKGTSASGIMIQTCVDREQDLLGRALRGVSSLQILSDTDLALKVCEHFDKTLFMEQIIPPEITDSPRTRLVAAKFIRETVHVLLPDPTHQPSHPWRTDHETTAHQPQRRSKSASPDRAPTLAHSDTSSDLSSLRRQAMQIARSRRMTLAGTFQILTSQMPDQLDAAVNQSSGLYDLGLSSLYPELHVQDDREAMIF